MNSQAIQVKSENILFQPWVGSKYGSESIFKIPILIVGESNWGVSKGAEKDSTFTHLLIESIIYARWQHNFFSTIQSTFAEKANSEDSRKEFWGSVAHCEYIQDWLPRPRVKPDKNMWKKAAPIFKDVVEQLKPKCILFTGKGLFNRATAGLSGDTLAIDESFAPTYKNPHVTVQINGALASWVYHPSAHGNLGHYSKGRGVVRSLIEAAGGRPLI
ncbi:hypothetical protein [Pseudanabaena sp. 'Roaring Creek']|uniref:hypothetical protein n=1 Tax=Pseudanabaena sp. 'Roaring Creek' TaxID=1681830 RepID=UPI0006D78B2F|nr:hypothetical protein [Pseudanabaena sp. 'Roaring Creek']